MSSAFPTALPPLLLLLSLGSSAGDWRVSLQRAVSIHQAGDLQGSSEHYAEAIKLNPELRKSWPVLTNYALSIQKDAPAEAVATFREVLEIEASADTLFNLGNALVDAGEHEEAEEALSSCLELNPSDADAYYTLASARMLQRAGDEKTAAAVDAVLASIALSPNDGKAWVTLGDGQAALGRWAESEAAYRQAAVLRPEHAATWVSLGNAQEELLDSAAAEASWRRAASLQPSEMGGAWQNLGGMLRRADRMAESRAAYEAAIRVEPTSAEAYLGLGKCYQAPALVSGEREASDRRYLQHLVSTYGLALRLQPSNAGAYNSIGEGLRMYGLHEGCPELGGGALQMYAHALRLAPDNTCAATHVAFGAREACSPEAIEELMGAESDAEVALEHGAGFDNTEPTVATLSVPKPPKGDAELEQAIALWRRQGVVVFPALLRPETADRLLEKVRAAQHGNHTRDYTTVTRDKAHRCHKSLSVRDAAEALEEIDRELHRFLHAALGTASPALLESGFMVTAPGASAQHFHRDVAPAVVSRSSMTVSIQVSLADTAAEQGSLEVIPTSQAYDPAVSDKTRVQTLPKVNVAVPKGTVTVYALHTMHRGSANTHTADRPFFFFTLAGDGLPPPGLAYTVCDSEPNHSH